MGFDQRLRQINVRRLIDIYAARLYSCTYTIQSGDEYDCEMKLFTKSLAKPEQFHLQCPKQVHVHLLIAESVVSTPWKMISIATSVVGRLRVQPATATDDSNRI